MNQTYQFQELKNEVAFLTEKQQAILRAIIYFEVFIYPLNQDELERYTGFRKLENSLQELVHAGLIKCKDGFYFTSEMDGIIQRRLEGNSRAEKAWKQAMKSAKTISRFPFVRCAAVSGSMSKNFLLEDGDVDFFIITSPKRLWVARLLLTAYKKVFLLNSRKYFCANYYVSSDKLEIQDKNIFTATELVTLVPVYNLSLYEELISNNRWSEGFYPSREVKLKLEPHPFRKHFVKSLLEKLLSGALGSYLDKVSMNMMKRRWKKKFGHFEEKKLEQTMRSTSEVSKHHPNDFQGKVLQMMQEKVEAFEQKHGVKINYKNG